MKLNSVEDVFVKIKCMISNMIQKLQQEEDLCDKERQLLGSGQMRYEAEQRRVRLCVPGVCFGPGRGCYCSTFGNPFQVPTLASC